MFGHIALSLLPGLLGVGVGLVLIALGSGGLKANATSLVGALYDENDPRRDAGFSIFYMGINIGALFGPLLTGLLQTNWGFHAGFALAAIGMAIGLMQYALGPQEPARQARTRSRTRCRPIGAGCSSAPVGAAACPDRRRWRWPACSPRTGSPTSWSGSPSSPPSATSR